MKRLIFLFIFGGMVLGGRCVLAQEFNYDKAYQDYEYNYSLYTRAHDDYVLAKARYLPDKTLISGEEAKKATLMMLQARDETVRTLLTAIQMRVNENKGLSGSQKESLFKQIDPEVKFYEDHKIKLVSAGSLDDLVSDSNKAKDRFESITQPLIYASLVNLSIGKTVYERGNVEKVIFDLKAKVAEIKSVGDKDTSLFDRNFIDLENKLTRSQDKETEAQDLVTNANKSFAKKVSYYNNAIAAIQGSYLYLREVATYLKEMIRIIKTN